MPTQPAKLEQLFDRTWRPGHPFCPRLSALRRRGGIVLLILLLTIIVGYGYLTDSTRVRAMCESYLSHLLGGKVTVNHAALSVFEGLRLDGVTVSISGRDTPDARIFDAQTFVIKYNLRPMLSGKLEATEILAIEPHVRLCEYMDVTSGPRWNYGLLIPSSGPVSATGIGALPIMTLRNGIVDYSKMTAGHIEPQGSVSLNGNLTPGDQAGTYFFRLQSSESESNDLGPLLSGVFDLTLLQIKHAKMENFHFSKYVRDMLPDMVGQWWDEHELSGDGEITDLELTAGGDRRKMLFKVETNLNNVSTVFQPRQWMSRDEIRRLETMHGVFDLLRAAGMDSPIAGASFHYPEPPPVEPGESGDSRTPAPHHFIEWLAALTEPAPIRLTQMSGPLIFTQDGIEFRKVVGRIETDSFVIDGHIDGYSASAPADIVIEGTDIFIPHHPRYVYSMPRPAHEFWEHLRPEGRCTLMVHMRRSSADAPPEIDGRVDVLDGKFQADQFTYSLRKVSGVITFGPDPATGEERLDILNLHGLGAEDGPNASVQVSMNGFVAPLGPDGEFSIVLKADAVQMEKSLVDAFPRDARKAMQMFDAGGSRGYPDARGDISVLIHRPAGPDRDFTFIISLNVADGSGSFVPFPYPLNHAQGKIEIGPGYVNIDGVHARRGDATVALDGTVHFGRNIPLEPNLKISARGLPMDQALLDALPAGQGRWLAKLGLTGKLDVDGSITRGSQADSDFDYDLKMSLRDGEMNPPDSSFKLTALSSALALNSRRLTFTDLKCRRGNADLSANGSLDFAPKQPLFEIAAAARDLELDAPLRDILPPAAQEAWDQLHMTGTLDADFSYKGALAAEPATRPSFSLDLKPRKLALKLRALPYDLSDIQGSARITSDKVELSGITGHHGDGVVLADGGAALDAAGATQKWDFHLRGQNIKLDDEFTRSLPEGLARIVKMMEASGTLAFDLPHLAFTCSTTRPSQEAPDMDIAGRLEIKNGSFNMAVPLGAVDGTMDLTAQIRSAKLAEFKADVKADSLTIAGRPGKRFVASLYKPADRQALRIDSMGGAYAGGELAGQIDLTFPDNDKSRYAVALVMRDVDVQKFMPPKDKTVKGALSASLSMEGVWDDPASRRGRGDVEVEGRDMYNVPLVLGLMQMTNLSLPFNNRFSQATARYSVAGPQVTFENIELRSENVVVTGNGVMNFDKGNLKMTFTADNPHFLEIPLLKEFKQELLQIHVTGKIEQPHVSAGMMGTFTTTIDHVFKAGEAEPEDSGPHK